ncbi:MAG: SPOR domain-containing protein [Magnetococcales bacterium]|nr:SPOR domain-containing protein [Magnetococcales bacterium]
MKASPNREQFLFLVTGGIILVLILMVVVFNMVRTPGDLIAEKETQPTPKVKVGDRTADSNKSAWLTQVAPAPIFNPEGAQNKSESKVEIDAKDLTAPDNNSGKPDASKPQEAWNPKEASALESARLESRPLSRDGGLTPAKNTPGDSHAAPPPMPRMAADGSGSRTAPPAPQREPAHPPQPSAQDQDRSDHSNDPNSALGSPPKRQQAKNAQKNQADDSEDAADTNDKPLQKPATPPPSGFSVQVASFNDTEHATALANKLSNLMFDGKRMPVYQNTQKAGKKNVFRVRLGPFPTQARAQQAANLANAKAGAKGTVLGPNQ